MSALDDAVIFHLEASKELAKLRKKIDDLKVFCDSAGINLQYQAGENKKIRAENTALRGAAEEARAILAELVDDCEVNQEMADFICICSAADDSVGLGEVLCEYHAAKIWLASHPADGPK